MALRFQASGGNALAILNDGREVLLTGCRGTGKTSALCAMAMKYMMRGYGPKWIGLVVRRRQNHLTALVKQWTALFNEHCPDIKFKTDQGLPLWIAPCGATLHARRLGAPDEAYNFIGWNIAALLVDETTGWPYDEPLSKLACAVRSPGSGIPAIIRHTTNSYGPGHRWVKQRFQIGEGIGIPRPIPGTSDSRIVIPSTIFDNPDFFRENPDYLAMVANECRNDKDLTKSWVNGDWDLALGGGFGDVFSYSKQVFHRISDMRYIPRQWKIYFAFDWGYGSPSCAQWWAISPGPDVPIVNITSDPECPNEKITLPAGSPLLVAELYLGDPKTHEGFRLSHREIAEKIANYQRERGFEDRVLPGPCEQLHDKTFAAALEECGINALKPYKAAGSRSAGFLAMRDLLAESHRGNGNAPGIYLTADCKVFLDTVPQLEVDDELNDISAGQPDHSYDCARMAMAHFAQMGILSKPVQCRVLR